MKPTTPVTTTDRLPTLFKLAEQKAAPKVRPTTEQMVPGQCAHLVQLNFIWSTQEWKVRSTTVIVTDEDDSTLACAAAVRWLNKELRTVRDLATGKESILPDDEKFPRVVTKADDPRLPLIPSVLFRRKEADGYCASLVRHGAIHMQDAGKDLRPFYKFVANLKRKPDGNVEKVADSL